MTTYITSLDDPRVLPYKSLKKKINSDSNTLVVETKRVILKAIKLGHRFESILCSEEDFEENEKEFEKALDRQFIFIAKKELLKKIVGHNLHHGQMGIIKKPPFSNLEEMEGPAIFLNGVTNPDNVGAIIRNCTGFGFKNLIFDSKSHDPFTRRALRVSMGNVFSMNIFESKDIMDDLKKLKEKEFNILGTAIRGETTNLMTYRFSQNFILIIGSEGHGADQNVLDYCDQRLFIPMEYETLALNAACSSAVFLYEASKQLREK